MSVPEAAGRGTGMGKGAVAVLFLGIGLVVGIFIGVGATKAGSAFIEDMASSEAAADVAHARKHSRPGFSFDYPGNWKIDTKDEDYDPDHLLSVESPGSCTTMIVVYDTPVDPVTSVRLQVDGFVPKLMASPARTPFSTWGKLAGEGMLLQGKLLGLNQGSVRIFSHASDKRSFTAIEQCFAEDMKDVQPGFDLIASSFQLMP